MPSYWTPKQERQYGHIKTSCIKRKCRTVRGKKRCVRICTRMAAATTNKFRARGLGARFQVTSQGGERSRVYTPHTRQHRVGPPSEASRARARAHGDASWDRHVVENALFHGSKTVHELRALPNFTNRQRALRHALDVLANDKQLVEHKGKRWRLSEHYWAQYGGDRPPESFKGLGNVRGKCCVVRGKTRIACFHSRKDAVTLKRSLKKTAGLRIRCV